MSEKDFEDNNIESEVESEVVEVNALSSFDFDSIGKDPYARLGEQVSQAAGNAILDIMKDNPDKTMGQAVVEFLFNGSVFYDVFKKIKENRNKNSNNEQNVEELNNADNEQKPFGIGDTTRSAGIKWLLGKEGKDKSPTDEGMGPNE